MARTTKSRWPNSRWGWYRYYVARFNKTESPSAEHLACWYWLMYLAFGEESIPKEENQVQDLIPHLNTKPATKRASPLLEAA